MRYFIARHINRKLVMGLVQYEGPEDRSALLNFFRDEDGDDVSVSESGQKQCCILRRGKFSGKVSPGDYIRPAELLMFDDGDSTYIYPQDIIEAHFDLEEMPERVGLLAGFIDCAQAAGDEWLYYSGVENGPYDEGD